MFFSESDNSLELLGVFKIKRDGHFSKISHERNYDIISVRLSGKCNFQTKERCFSSKKGDILYLPKTLEYSQETSGESIIAIHFINYSFKKDNNAELITLNNSEYAESIVRKMYDIWKEKKQGHKYKCTSLLYELLYFVNCQQYNNTIELVTHNDKIKAAIDYIHANFRNNAVEVSYLAKMSGFSETYFRKLFKQIHLVSPNQYIINLRLEYASHLLGSQLYTVSEAGYKSGFNDIKYFIKLFKKHYGVTPKKYQSPGNT